MTVPPGEATGAPRAEVHARRLRSQLLSGPPAPDAVSVVDRLLAVQAQDLRGARLAVRARSTVGRVAEVDAAFDDGSLVVTWLLRGTLHLVRASDHWWLHDLVAARHVTANRRRLRQEGLDDDAAARGVEVVATTVQRRGPLRRGEIRAALDDAGVRTAGQALVHLLMAASLAGHIVRGPVLGGEQAFVSTDSWLGPRPATLDRAEALSRLGARYLAGHGPGDAADLARWSGLGLRDAGAALAHPDPVPGGLVPELPAPRLLGPFDPVLLGWADRTDVIGPHTGVITNNGVFRPFALVDGRAVATWRMARDRVAGISWIEEVGAADRAALDRDAAAVEAFLG